MTSIMKNIWSEPNRKQQLIVKITPSVSSGTRTTTKSSREDGELPRKNNIKLCQFADKGQLMGQNGDTHS